MKPPRVSVSTIRMIGVWPHRLTTYRDRVVLLDAADRVKFVPIGREEFDYIARRVEEGSYEFNVTGYQRFSVRAYKAWAASLDRRAWF